MKKNLLIFAECFISLVLILFTSMCGTSDDNKPKKAQPINLSVYLDLSDRLKRELVPSQFERDTAIINHLVDKFITNIYKNKVLSSKDAFQIFFYPAPQNSAIATIAKNLKVDFEGVNPKDKKKLLSEMKSDVQKGLGIIYNEALKAGNWEGSDIWGFFSDKKVDDYCVRSGYRNIIIILTDGYFFHKDNKINEGKAYSYILPQTLKIPDSSLIVRRAGLDNLEVLVLEVNPYDKKDLGLIKDKVKNWFMAMGVAEDNFKLVGIDLPGNTERVIDNFLDKKK